MLVMLLPPPAPEIYELSEVAERLHGAAVQPVRGDALKRELRAEPPAEHGDPDPRRDALARLLRLPPSEVVLVEPMHEGFPRHERRGSPPLFRGPLMPQHGGPHGLPGGFEMARSSPPCICRAANGRWSNPSTRSGCRRGRAGCCCGWSPRPCRWG
jgi:hypothetical protein